MKSSVIWTFATLLCGFATNIMATPAPGSAAPGTGFTMTHADRSYEELPPANVSDLALAGRGAELSRRATQLQINFYSNRECTAYVGHLNYDWAGRQGSGETGCYNYQYGTSLSIANCYGPAGHCMCLFYQQPNCGGGYSSSRYAPGGAYSCRRNGDRIKSMRCYYY